MIQSRHQSMEERFLLPQLVAVADGTTDDAPQHIAAAFVRRQHAVGDQEEQARIWSAMTRREGLFLSLAPVALAAASISFMKRSIS